MGKRKRVAQNVRQKQAARTPKQTRAGRKNRGTKKVPNEGTSEEMKKGTNEGTNKGANVHLTLNEAILNERSFIQCSLFVE